MEQSYYRKLFLIGMNIKKLSIHRGNESRLNHSNIYIYIGIAKRESGGPSFAHVYVINKILTCLTGDHKNLFH